MRTWGIAALGAFLVLVDGPIGVWATPPSIEIYGWDPDTGLTDFGKCQDSAFPRGLPMNISIFVRLGDPTGISGAEFFCKERSPTGNDIRVFESVANGGLGWGAAIFPSVQDAVFGHPFAPSGVPPDIFRRYNIAFPVNGPAPADGCRTGDADAPPGYVRLLEASISKGTAGNAIPTDTILYVSAGEPPSGALACPLVNLCDAPAFTAVCASSGQFFINPTIRYCEPAVESKAWGAVKSLYR